jgi:hypothetical protein
MSELCKWVHERLEALPVFSFPFDLEQLPRNGIYFFLRAGEVWAHGGRTQGSCGLAPTRMGTSAVGSRSVSYWRSGSANT